MTHPEKEANGLDNPTFIDNTSSEISPGGQVTALQSFLYQTDDGKHHCNFTEDCATVLDYEEKPEDFSKQGCNKLAYTVTDIPPWYLCIFLGIQHYLTALGGLVAIPLILSKSLCLEQDTLTQSYLISTIFFVSGICTLLQVIFGVRVYLGVVLPGCVAVFFAFFLTFRRHL